MSPSDAHKLLCMCNIVQKHVKLHNSLLRAYETYNSKNFLHSHMISSLPSVDFLGFTALNESAFFESLRRE
jgi:hypothetical protein